MRSVWKNYTELRSYRGKNAVYVTDYTTITNLPCGGDYGKFFTVSMGKRNHMARFE